MSSRAYETVALCGYSQIDAGLIEPSGIQILKTQSEKGGDIFVPVVKINVLATSIDGDIQMESCSRRPECHTVKCIYPVRLKEVPVDKSTALVVELN